ncbi:MULTISPECIES: hypothetical protein [Proteus]|uniref:ASCH domain-containing protein n=1 Tax=Proteus columbae TaxID=1987580 RepID=A0A6I7DFP9_9GAMM|nr:hypothetical protein [Proteus columbae]MBG3020001.1 hypothetical protein [Proteus mirabilis]QHN12280.1 hypothetical protein F1325_18320 [Proteus columbae]
MKKIIISIKPKYVQKIYDGNKVIELRKSIGLSFKQNNKMYIYSSSPKKAITGHAYIDKIEQVSKDEIKQYYLDKIAISNEELENYLIDGKKGMMIWLKNIVEYKKPITLAKLKETGFTAPQSYCYVSDALNLLLDENT